jgi:hypothetical protein
VLQDLGATLDNVRAEIERLELTESEERPKAPLLPYKVGQWVLIHDPNPPHRLWEGRITVAERKRYGSPFLDILWTGWSKRRRG